MSAIHMLYLILLCLYFEQFYICNNEKINFHNKFQKRLLPAIDLILKNNSKSDKIDIPNRENDEQKFPSKRI